MGGDGASERKKEASAAEKKKKRSTKHERLSGPAFHVDVEVGAGPSRASRKQHLGASPQDRPAHVMLVSLLANQN